MSLPHWLHQHLPRAWLRRGPLACLLWPLALVYGALFALRHQMRRHLGPAAQRLPVPVLVVGNVVAGGAGKTPLTMALVLHLQSRGWHPGVISKGHGRLARDTRAVCVQSLSTEVGDEPLLIQQKTRVPVWVAAQRVDAGRALLQQHPSVDILVCDDGLQDAALARDLDICVMDERGVGNGWLLPAGPLREPWPKKVDLVLHTGVNGLKGGFQAQRQLASHGVNAHGQQFALASLSGQSVDAVAGLARPEAFFGMLRDAGLSLHQTLALPDHFDFAHWPKAAWPRTLLCTEKDAVKLWRHQAHALAVPLLLKPEPAFWQALDQGMAEKSLQPARTKSAAP